tara:strand:+ start:556 stop:927 length:372 start_codon:yes stop_codon:yes gene_type:complete
MKKIFSNLKELFLWSDSEPNEILIGLLHAFILPIAILEIGSLWFMQVIAISSGLFQLYAVGTKDIWCRRLACFISVVVSFTTVVDYITTGAMKGSQLGWILIFIFAVWNLTRVSKEYRHKDGQ